MDQNLILETLYRSVAALAVAAEVFEKLVHGRPFDHLERFVEKILVRFFPKHSTETSLLHATNQ